MTDRAISPQDAAIQGEHDQQKRLSEMPAAASHIAAARVAGLCVINFDSPDRQPFSLQPYMPFAPLLWTGFEEGGAATARQGVADDGQPALFFELRPGPSRWMTLELALDADEVRKCGFAMGALQAAAVPRTQIKASLRIPSDEERQFEDTAAQNIFLDSRIREAFFHFRAPNVNFASSTICPRPLLLLTFPLRDVTICLRKISFAPAVLEHV